METDHSGNVKMEVTNLGAQGRKESYSKKFNQKVSAVKFILS